MTDVCLLGNVGEEQSLASPSVVFSDIRLSLLEQDRILLVVGSVLAASICDHRPETLSYCHLSERTQASSSSSSSTPLPY